MRARSEVTLRPLEEADALSIAAWGQDETFRRHADWSDGVDLASWWRRSISTPDPELLRLGADVEDQLVGYVDLHGPTAERKELGFLVGPREMWGKGLGTRLAEAGISHAFEKLGVTRVWAEALDANRASVRVLQRVGMREMDRGGADQFLGEPTYWRIFELSR